ncbi:MAG: hypothetical protein ACRESZ_16555 [Methylococcales bacterium]
MISFLKFPELTSLLLGLCGVLALVNGVEWFYLSLGIDHSRQDVNKPVISDIVFEEISNHEFVLPPKDSFSEFVERPLMIPGRRPVPEMTDEPLIPVLVNRGKIQIKLMGIVMSPNGMTALLQDGKGAYKNLPVNGTIDGWELNEMHPDRVILKQDDVREELKLRKPKPKKPIQDLRQKPTPNQKAQSDTGEAPATTPPTLGYPERNAGLRKDASGLPSPITGIETPENQ